MIIAFCGLSDFIKTDALEEKMMSVLREKIGDSPAELFLGGYGAFDSFALFCGRKYKKKHPDVKLVLITPYIDRVTDGAGYDETVYPPIENVPYRFAICERNKWMVERADLVVAYVNHSHGGAFTTFRHAQKKNKRIINIADDISE